MKLSRILFIILVLILAFVPAGCSSTPADGESPKSSQSAAAPTPAPPAWTVVKNTSATFGFNQVGFLNENLGIAVSAFGVIYNTVDGGKAWNQAKNASACRFGLDIVDENIAWCAGNGDQVRVTNDGGKNWSAVTDFSVGGTQGHVSFIDGLTGWIGSMNKFGSTTDGGKTWTELKLPEESKRIAALNLRTANDGYVLTTEGILYITGDAGKTWTSKDLGLASLDIQDSAGIKGRLYSKNVPCAAIHFEDEKNALIVFIVSGSDKSTRIIQMCTADGGDTWSSNDIKAPDGFKPETLYISKDGSCLTMTSSSRGVVVLKRD